MCTTCGCGHPEQVRIGELPHSHDGDNATKSSKTPPHFSTATFQAQTTSDDTQKRLLKLEIDVLSKNNRLADQNRRFFANQQMRVFNLVYSPG